MYIVNPDGVLIYKDSIDDKPSTNKDDIPGAKNYFLGVSTASTTPYGCSVKYK